jgi:hypothetical protein
MIESNFSSSECAKSVGFSGSQFKTVVEALHDAAGNRLPGPKPVEQMLPITRKRIFLDTRRLAAFCNLPLCAQ